ncbi:hypothetical protein MA16_Dca018528 [Dendrobium catenatum]|uniref:Tf2-1-like SH3-like domain-containing protein n=1 Tax=Dendrobium catenatum TaxID=906689 RepID=A0A2I0VQP9_9ASPA|nr:hypothetical protein MA16_Dca018528 [Dendrobium catenatum]
MTPYEALYGRRCRTPLCWAEAGERKIIGADLVDDATEKIRLIRDRLKAVQDRQKKYYDAKHRFVEFEVGEFVFLKVSPMKGVKRFGKVGKLSPRYVGHFEISERVGSVAYRLILPSHMSGIHNVLHISSLRKYITDEAQNISTEAIDIQPDLTFVEEPEKIIYYNVKQLRSREIPYVKVMWKHGTEKDATWEKESEMRESYPHLFG